MEKPSEVVKWFFLFLQSESAILMRIEFLVVVIAFLYQLMSFLDRWRCRSRSSTIKYILLILDAIADSTYLYTIGLMQSAPFKKDMFPVWALVLANLRFSGCFISAYGIPDQENRRISELSNVMALLGVAFLNSTRNSQFKHPIWALWAMQLVRSFYLIYAYNSAVKSSLHGRSSMFLASSPDHSDETSEVNLSTMEGYGYPVCGDQKQKFKVKAPSYNLIIDDQTTEPTQHTRKQWLFFCLLWENWFKKAPITLDKIWKHDGALNNMTCKDKDVKLIKDMCLSFSLYRQLRCRFDDLPLSRDIAEKTKRLLTKFLKDEVNRERTLRIVESELAFLSEYFYTRYPVLFFRGLPLLATLHPVLTIAFIFWLGRDIHKVYRPRDGEIAHVIRGVNVDLIITWVFMGVVVVKELWKTLNYVLSDWTKVMVLCEYVAENMILIPKWIRDNWVWILCTPRFKIVKHWHGKIGQYEFLRSYVYNPWKWNIFFYMSLGMVPRGTKGMKIGESIKLPEEVKDAILSSLRFNLKEDPPGEEKNVNEDSLVREKNHDLPSVTTFLDRNESNPRTNQIDWNPLLDEIKRTLRQPTCAHVILIWHIATSLCEIDLAQHYNTSLTDSEALHALKSAKSCFSTQPYMIKLQRLEHALRANYTVANSISRYCTYLLVSVPDLLPDSYFVPKLILKSTVLEASKILDGCDNLQSIYRRLMREAEDRQDNNNKEDNDLIEDDEKECKCSDLTGISCFLSSIKGVYRCFFPEKKGTRDGGQPSTGGDGGDGSRNRENSNFEMVITVDEREFNNQSARNGRRSRENGNPEMEFTVDKGECNDQNGGNGSRGGENSNPDTTITMEEGECNNQSVGNGSRTGENGNPDTKITTDGEHNDQGGGNSSRSGENSNFDTKITEDEGEHNNQSGGNGSMGGENGNPDTAITMEEGECNDQSVGNGSMSGENGNPDTKITVDREHQNQSGGNSSRCGENCNFDTEITEDKGEHNDQSGGNGSRNGENSNPKTAITRDEAECNNQNGGNGYRVGENGNPHTAITMDEGELNDQCGENDCEGKDTVHHEKIIRMGARLGRLLINATKHDDVARWELLAGVWADLLVHMAPSWNTEAHRRCLATGGEFITQIWAILCHCGVEKSNLWQLQEATGEDQGQAQQAAATADKTLATAEAEKDDQLKAIRRRVFERGETSSSRCA